MHRAGGLDPRAARPAIGLDRPGDGASGPRAVTQRRTAYEPSRGGRRGFAAWRERPAPKRGDFVRDSGSALREFKEPLGDLVTIEMGKIRAEGHGEVQEMIDICDFAVGLSRQLYGLTHRLRAPGPPHDGAVASARAGRRHHRVQFPGGRLGLERGVAAVCGDPVHLEAVPKTPLCAVASSASATGVDGRDGCRRTSRRWSRAGRDIGARIDRRPALAARSRFTGSTAVGRRGREAVAARFGRTILELGGNNAIVVTDGAELDLATRAILFGAVGTAGQRCTTTRRLFVARRR